MGGPEWTLVVIVGPVLLVLALAVALVRNRGRTQRDEDRTEQATRRFYDEEEARERRR